MTERTGLMVGCTARRTARWSIPRPSRPTVPAWRAVRRVNMGCWKAVGCVISLPRMGEAQAGLTSCQRSSERANSPAEKYPPRMRKGRMTPPLVSLGRWPDSLDLRLAQNGDADGFDLRLLQRDVILLERFGRHLGDEDRHLDDLA